MKRQKQRFRFMNLVGSTHNSRHTIVARSAHQLKMSEHEQREGENTYFRSITKTINQVLSLFNASQTSSSDTASGPDRGKLIQGLLRDEFPGFERW